MFGQHLSPSPSLGQRLKLTPLGHIFIVFGTINLIDNLSSSIGPNVDTLVCLRYFDSFNACSCHMHNISFLFPLFHLFLNLSLCYVNFDKWCKQSFQLMSVFCVDVEQLKLGLNRWLYMGKLFSFRRNQKWNLIAQWTLSSKRLKVCLS